jgi:hypothetical protein
VLLNPFIITLCYGYILKVLWVIILIMEIHCEVFLMLLYILYKLSISFQHIMTFEVCLGLGILACWPNVQVSTICFIIFSRVNILKKLIVSY